MVQFTVHRNSNPATSADYPLLLDVQSDLLADLGTRVVVPLCPACAMQGRLLKTLTPVFEVRAGRTPCSLLNWRVFRKNS